MSDPCIPDVQSKEWMPTEQWLAIHENLLEKRDESGFDLVFLGDSITAGWLGEGIRCWHECYEPLNAVNFGISGDEVQHVHWRVQNGLLEGLSPKVLVLLIGTNNIGNAGHRAVGVATGIGLLLKAIQARLPDTKILLISLFPRDASPGTPFRQAINQINESIAELDNGESIFYLDISDVFLLDDGTLPESVMPDALHLSARGYGLWADAMNPTLLELLKA